MSDNENPESDKRGPGRPEAEIDWDKVGRMLEAGCTAEGIAATFGIHVNTLRSRCWQDNKIVFSALRQQKRAKGDDLLRVKQYQLAMEGHPTMLIWLGKQRLDQTDKRELTGKDGGPVIIKWVDPNEPVSS